MTCRMDVHTHSTKMGVSCRHLTLDQQADIVS